MGKRPKADAVTSLRYCAGSPSGPATPKGRVRLRPSHTDLA